MSAAYGRPLSVFASQTNVDLITLDDFIEEDGHIPDTIHATFFLQYVKLCKVLQLVAFKPVKRNRRKPGSDDAPGMRSQTDIGRREAELNEWLADVPKEMEWMQSKHEFWAGVLSYLYK